MDVPATVLLACFFTAVAVPVLFWAITPIWDSIVSNLISDLTPQMESMNMDTSTLPDWLRAWGIMMGLTFVMLGFVAGMWPIAFGIVVLIYSLPRFIINGLIATRRTVLRDQLVGAAVALGNSCRAGLSLPQAFDTVSKEINEPLATEFRRISRDYQGGRPFPEALMDVKQRMDLDSFTLFASAILVCLQAGGNVTVSLEKICLNLQENQRLERKLEADTESGRKVVLILAAFPWLFLAGFYVFEPEGTELMFTTIVGNLVLLIIGALVYIAYRWALKILTIEV